MLLIIMSTSMGIEQWTLIELNPMMPPYTIMMIYERRPSDEGLSRSLNRPVS